MATHRLLASLALIAACVRNDPAVDSTFPEPTEVAGPPGGEMDRGGSSPVADDTGAAGELGYDDSSSEPQAAAEMTAACTDDEITATLDPYGEWIYVEGYGEVWRPYTTAVGANFTPYETCGSWVWTEWGWTFACEWDWGWLPFHYGQWGWFNDYWAWVPGYEWSPAWVEWRGGGGYVGWRPVAPTVRDHRSSTYAGGGVRDHRSGPIVRDHRTGPRVRDHRTRVAQSKDWQWRFAAINDLGKPRIRAHLYKSLAEGLRVTKAVATPPVRPAIRPVRAESIMRSRLAFANRALPEAQVAPTRRRVDERVGGRIDAAPVRGSSRGTVRGERPSSTDGPIYQPSWQTRRPARDSIRGGSQATSAGPSVEYTPTTPTPTPPAEPTTQHPLKVPDRYTPTMTTPPMQSVPPPVAQPQPQPPRQVPDRVAPVQQPQRAPERHAPPRYSPPSSSPPVSSPPPRAPERYTPPPTYTPPSRSSAPSYSPPARSSPPSYSPPSRTSSPPPNAPRSHRR